MFEWFNKTFRSPKYPTWDDIPPVNDMEKLGADMKKIIPFPESKNSESPKEGAPAKKESKAVTYYRLGITSDNRVSFQMTHSEITMNSTGVDKLIEQLEFYRNCIIKNEEEQE